MSLAAVGGVLRMQTVISTCDAVAQKLIASFTVEQELAVGFRIPTRATLGVRLAQTRFRHRAGVADPTRDVTDHGNCRFAD